MKQYYQGLSLKVKLFVIFLLVIIANFVANLFYRHEVKNLIEFYNFRIFKKCKVEAG